MIGRRLGKPLISMAVALLAIGGGFGLYWFQPWKAFTDQAVDEALTTAGPTTPRLIAEGRFVSHEHPTSGTARIVQTPDGRRRLELVGLDTSNGPDLRVWLTDQRVIESRAGWSVFDDGRYHELGRLKGNRGNQGYDIPADLDLEQFRSVSIWCKRFSVSFGAAAVLAVR